MTISRYVIILFIIIILCQQIATSQNNLFEDTPSTFDPPHRRRLKKKGRGNKRGYRHKKSHINIVPITQPIVSNIYNNKYDTPSYSDLNNYATDTYSDNHKTTPNKNTNKDKDNSNNQNKKYDSDDDKKDVECNDFMRNGYIYSMLQADAAVLLRGMNLMSSDEQKMQKRGIHLYEKELYPYMSDSFTWSNVDGGTVVSSKSQLKDKALKLAREVPNSMGIESYGYFECVERKGLVMIMRFNAMERWDDKKSEVSRKDGGDPDTIERWWHCAMYFEYDYDKEKFMISRFEYDDPLNDEE
eukprot:317814_1